MNINIGEILLNLWNDSGLADIVSGFMSANGWQYALMLVISFLVLDLAIAKKFEPLRLVGIAFGALTHILWRNPIFYPQILCFDKLFCRNVVWCIRVQGTQADHCRRCVVSPGHTVGQNRCRQLPGRHPALGPPGPGESFRARSVAE
jgi:hypothetical protein